MRSVRLRKLAGILTEMCSMINKMDDADNKMYTCPMHPDVVRDHPGRCPDCGMNLVPTGMPSSEGPYQCPECGLHYNEKEWADKCEVWCKEHKSCNLVITSHAIENNTKTS